MSHGKLQRFTRYIPLWQQRIPRYPLYWKGNPQLRVTLPLFWMKLIKPERKIPPNIVKVEVHPQMTSLDIKQYLEKIYNIPVTNVRTMRGKAEEVRDQERGFILDKRPERKYAFVQLTDRVFEYPDIFEKKSQQEKDLDEMRKITNEMEKDKQKNWSKRDIPSWFR